MSRLQPAQKAKKEKARKEAFEKAKEQKRLITSADEKITAEQFGKWEERQNARIAKEPTKSEMRSLGRTVFAETDKAIKMINEMRRALPKEVADKKIKKLKLDMTRISRMEAKKKTGVKPGERSPSITDLRDYFLILEKDTLEIQENLKAIKEAKKKNYGLDRIKLG